VANKTKKYDLQKADRRRNLMIRVALTAVVILFAAGLGWWIISNKKEPIEPIGISVSEPDKLIKDPGSGEPKARLTIYEDALCPHCGSFEKLMGSTVNQLIQTGAVQADYYMVAILDEGRDNYSSRAANAAYCVAEADNSPNEQAFRRFHTTLFAQQPSESGGAFPTDEKLIEWARQAGLTPEGFEQATACINDGKYIEMVKGLAANQGIQGTPVIKINGEDFLLKEETTPQDLINKVTQITGEVPNLTVPPTPPPAATTPPSEPAPAGP
jgi:protein-disulfide isomerase